MTEENSELDQVATGEGETAPLATEQNSAEAQVAEGQGETTPSATEDEKLPPFHDHPRWQEVQGQLKAAQSQIEQYQAMLMQQQAMRAAVETKPAEQPPDLLRQIGVGPDDIYTEDGLRRFTKGINDLVEQKVAGATQQVRQQLEQAKFQQEANDFNEIVGVQNAFGFQTAPAMQRALQEDPGLNQRLSQIPDPFQRSQEAYRAAKYAKRIMDLEAQVKGTPTAQDIARDVAAKTAPMSSAAAGAGGAFTKARTVGELSEEEFARMDEEAAGIA